MRKASLLMFCAVIVGLYSCQEETPENEAIKSDPKTKGTRTVIDLYGSPAHVRDMGDYYLFQGDIKIDKESLNQDQAKTNGASMDGKRWPSDTVYYKIKSDVPDQFRVTNAIAHIEQYTNIKFVALASPNPLLDDYIEIVRAPNSSDYAGSSYLGKVGGRQELELHDVYASTGTAIHEFLHALGIFHEQTREDRNTYITVNFGEIPGSWEDQYEIYSDGFDQGPFDFSSIMLYSSSDADEDGIWDMVKVSNNQPFFAQRSSLSTGDKAVLNQIYRPIVESGGSVSTDTKFYFADVNGDGKSDKIYWQFDKHGGDIRVALATGLGNFAPYVHSSGSSSSSTKFYFADVNGDGKADKIYWKYDSYGGDIRVALATTGGAFGSYVQSGGSADSPTNFYFADINGDGKDDKIYWNAGNHSGDVRVGLATTGGNFASYVHSGGSADATTRFYFGDVNADGKFDKIYWNYNNHGGDVRTALSTTGGAFASYVHSSGSSSLATQFYFADVNGDNLYDKVYWKYDSYGGDVRPFLSASGIFNTLALQTAGSVSSSTKMYYSDVDGDGKADRISWNYNSHGGRIRVFLSN